jgi:putative oxidoreductase
MAMESILTAWQPRMLSILRIMTALLFLQHGLMKLIGFPVPGPAHLTPLLMVATAIEVVGSVLVTLGVYTKFH